MFGHADSRFVTSSTGDGKVPPHRKTREIVSYSVAEEVLKNLGRYFFFYFPPIRRTTTEEHG